MVLGLEQPTACPTIPNAMQATVCFKRHVRVQAFFGVLDLLEALGMFNIGTVLKKSEYVFGGSNQSIATAARLQCNLPHESRHTLNFPSRCPCQYAVAIAQLEGYLL